jgi:hypothetical protein
MVSLPGPNATRAEIDAFYQAQAAPGPVAKVWHDFDGKNCERPCRGWDGTSGRCDCGNRRVYWDEEGGVRFARAD